MRSLTFTGLLLLAGTAVGFAQAPRAPLSTIFRSKLAFYLPAPDSTPISTSVVVTSSNNPIISQNTWVEIHGTNLAQTVALWNNEDFSKGLPTTIAGSGVSATVNNKPAAIYYISPTQINILTPLDAALGPVPVQVTTQYGKTTILNSTMAAVSPGFLVFDVGGHVTAQHSDFSLLGPASFSAPGYTFTPAKPGETIILYAVGFGQPNPPITDQLTGAGPLPTPWPSVTIGNVPATVSYAGLLSAGLYQLNVVVPSVADGEQPISASYGGSTTQKNGILTVQH